MYYPIIITITINMHIKHFLFITALLCSSLWTYAQSPVSGFMNGKGKGSIAVSYTAEQYDQVFLVPVEASGVPVFNEVDVSSISLYGTYGISNKLDAVLGLPYIKARGNASAPVLSELGYENERSGVQDLSLFLKYNPYTCKFGGNQLRFVLAGGLKTPLGNYKVDEGLQSIIAIGNRATSVNGLAIAQFQSKSGFFLSGQTGYSLRSGRVPNALTGEVKAGYGNRYFYFDAWYAGQVSDGGTNILAEGFDGFFPATDVTFTRAGVNLYIPIKGGVGFSAGASRFLTGRNVGASTGYSMALIYSW
jgi:hypothetical protein